jgi:hypothetical protein
MKTNNHCKSQNQATNQSNGLSRGTTFKGPMAQLPTEVVPIDNGVAGYPTVIACKSLQKMGVTINS